MAADTELAGQSLAEGDRDARTFDAPVEVRLDRANAADHLAFGTGSHRCLGARACPTTR